MPVIEFYNAIKSCNFIFKDGTVAAFINGAYRTEDETEIAELRAEIAKRNMYLSGGVELTQEQLDPLSAMRAKIIAEYLASEAALRAASIDKTNDMGGNGAGAAVSGFGAVNSDGTIDALATDPVKLQPTTTRVLSPAGVITPVNTPDEVAPVVETKVSGLRIPVAKV